MDAGVAPPVVDAGPPPVPPAELPPVELPIVLELEQTDGGVAALPLSKTPSTCGPAKKFWLTLPWLTNFRVRVFDGADRVVPSDDDAQPGDAGVVYAITLVEPLKRGKDYRVLIDSETGTGLTADTGQRYLDAEWSLTIDGPADPEPKQKPGKKPGKKR